MAHQLNNPLTGLRSMTQLLYNSPGLESSKEDLRAMEKAITQSQNIIKNLLSFSQTQGVKKSCNLNQAVKNCLPLLKNRSQGILIKQNFSTEYIEVKGDLAVWQQVAYNLILNACQALKESPKDKELWIEIHTKKISKLKLV